MRTPLSVFGLAVAAAFFAAGVPAAQAQADRQYAQRCDTTIQITNNSSSTVTGFFFNPTGISSWGPNRLGGRELYPGQRIALRLPNPVPFDFRVVWVSTASDELRNVNICLINEVSITNRGLRSR